MKKNGFTLVELLAVITIFAILCILAIPPILNQVNNNKDAANDTNLKIIYKAVDLYVDTPEINSTYCVSLQELVDRDLLSAPIRDMSTGNDFDLQRQVELVIDGNGNHNYKILDKGKTCKTSTPTPPPTEYAVGDKVKVLGLDHTFHVFGVDKTNGTLKLLCDDALGYSIFSDTVVTDFKNSTAYSNLMNYTKDWKNKISSAGGSTSNYEVTLVSRKEIEDFLRTKNPNIDLSSGQVDITSIQAEWLWKYNYIHDKSQSGAIIGFFTSTIDGERMYSMIYQDYSKKLSFQPNSQTASDTYGMDIRPLLIISSASVKGA